VSADRKGVFTGSGSGSTIGVKSLPELWEVQSTDTELCGSADGDIEWPDVHVLDFECS